MDPQQCNGDPKWGPEAITTFHVLGDPVCSSAGPSLCVQIDGLVLSANELCQLQNPVNPFHLQGAECYYGFGMQSCYLITDLPMVISGDGFFLWDPTGKLLGMSSSEHVPQGRHYKHVGSDLMDRYVNVVGVQIF